MSLILLVMCIYITACAFPTSKNLKDQPLIETVTKTRSEANVKKMKKEFLLNMPLEFKQIHEKGKLDVAMYSEDRFPYFFLNKQGELVGSDVDLAYDIAHQIGVNKVEFHRSAKNYDEMIQLVAKRKVDVAISKISVTLNRAQRVLFSEPYIMLKQAVLINRIEYAKEKTKETRDPITLLKTGQVHIGVLNGTSYMEFAEEIFLSAKIIPYKTREQMLHAVQKGEIIAAFYDEFEFKQYVKDHPDILIDLQLAAIDDRKDYIAVAIPPDHLRMQAWLKDYFAYRSPLDIDQVLNQYSDQRVGHSN